MMDLCLPTTLSPRYNYSNHTCRLGMDSQLISLTAGQYATCHFCALSRTASPRGGVLACQSLPDGALSSKR